MVRIWQRQENTVSTNALDNFRDQGVAVLQATMIAFVFGSVDDSGILTVKRTNIDLKGMTVGAARIDLSNVGMTKALGASLELFPRKLA